MSQSTFNNTSPLLGIFINAFRRFCNCTVYIHCNCTVYIHCNRRLLVFILSTFICLCRGLIMTRVQGRNWLPRNKMVHKVCVGCDWRSSGYCVCVCVCCTNGDVSCKHSLAELQTEQVTTL